MIQRPAFQNEVVTFERHTGGPSDLVGDRVVVLEFVFAAPAVEAEGGGLGRTRPEDRPGVAQPDVAEPAVHDLDIGDPGEAGSGIVKGLGLADHQLHMFTARSCEGADQGLDLGLCRLEIVLPKLAMAGPADPHGTMRRPFGGDVERIHGASSRRMTDGAR